MISTALSRGKIIDCRMLTVSAEFVEMSEQQIDRLAISFYEKIAELFSDECILRWKFVGEKTRIIKDIESALLNQKRPNGCFFMGLQGAVKSDLIYNAKSFKVDEINCLYGLHPDSNYSQDFIPYYEQNIQNCGGEKLRDNVLKLFSESGRYYKGYYNASDLHAFFNVTCERESGLFYGDFEFIVSAYSLQSETDRIAGAFSEYLKSICSEFNNINSRISLMPPIGANWHCRYFSAFPSNVEETIENAKRWRGAMYTYIHGAEWFNIVSPRTISELSASNYPYNKEKFTMDTLKNGALQVKCTADISKVDVEDIRNVKAYLYNYLLPGEQIFSLKTVRSDINIAPRRMWEICPMFCEEVEVTEYNLIFRHNSVYYPEKLRFDNW